MELSGGLAPGGTPGTPGIPGRWAAGKAWWILGGAGCGMYPDMGVLAVETGPRIIVFCGYIPRTIPCTGYDAVLTWCSGCCWVLMV